jgi:hypothetical protein
MASHKGQIMHMTLLICSCVSSDPYGHSVQKSYALRVRFIFLHKSLLDMLGWKEDV